LAGHYEVHPSQIARWKRQLLEGLPEIFSGRRGGDQQQQEELTARLYQRIGQLKVELDWVKKIWPGRLRDRDNHWKGPPQPWVGVRSADPGLGKTPT